MLDFQQRAWLLLAYGSEQGYDGSEPHEDIVDKVYRYDNFVHNSRQIAEGDIAVLRNTKHLLGVARIVDIIEEKGWKKRKRCPICNVPNLDKRSRKKPEYRCDKGHEFDKPIDVSEPCTKYSAYFKGTYISAEGVLDRHELAAACPRHNQQLSMQRIDLEQVMPRLLEKVPEVQRLFSSPDLWIYAKPEDGALEPYEPVDEDRREEIMKSIKERRGQQKFRQELRQHYGDRCVVTGCQLVDVLEAAHISPYRGEHDNAIENGLLLRADIHTLFDLDLLGIDPESLKIHFHPRVKLSQYREYEGQKLLVAGHRPSKIALGERWQRFKDRLET